MGTNFFRSLIAGASLMLLFSVNTFATDYVHRVIIINEGYNDFNTGNQIVPVSLATYDPAMKTYAVFDEVEGARFATEAIVEGEYIYVAADSFLLKYDRNTLQLLAQQTVIGIRSIAAWNDKLIVTRGEYLMQISSFFQVYNQSDLSFDYELDTISGPKYATQNIEVVGDKAYFVINNAFDFPNYKGLLGVVDLINETYVNEFDLGADGLNPDNLMRDGDKLYTLNNKDFTGSSVSVINIDDETVVTTNLTHVTSGCGTSAFYLNNVWYQQYGSQKVHLFDPNNASVSDSVEFNKNFYGLGVDPVNNLLYATTTDFVSTGMAYIYDASHALIDSFVCGVSAGNIAFDVRKVSGVRDNMLSSVKIYPTLVTDELTIETGDKRIEKVEVFDLNGKSVFTTGEYTNRQPLQVANIAAGMYHLLLTAEDGSQSGAKFVKQ